MLDGYKTFFFLNLPQYKTKNIKIYWQEKNEKGKCGIREMGNVRVKRESTITKGPCRDDLREDNGSDRLHKTHILKLRIFLSFSPSNMGERSHIL